VYSSSQGCLAASGTHHMPYGITQCYLPPGRGDILALTTYEAGTRFSDPGGMRIGADGCAVQKRMNRYKAHDQIIRFSLAQLSREPVWGRSRLIRGEQIDPSCSPGYVIHSFSIYFSVIRVCPQTASVQFSQSLYVAHGRDQHTDEKRHEDLQINCI